jgi:hypothetical protein
MSSRAKVLFNTVRYLKFKQVFYRLFYHVYTPKYKQLIRSSANTCDIDNILYNSHSFVPNLNSFCFINKSKLFGKRIDWEYSAYGRLWTYNLNYFEFLNQQDINELQGRVLIDNYIKDITNRKTGMEPYPLSLRIMNWVKFFSRFNIHDTEYNSVLYSQSALLSKKIEYHLLGNHLLENGFALLWSAYFFGEYKFYNIAKKILIKELNEQVLGRWSPF